MNRTRPFFSKVEPALVRLGLNKLYSFHFIEPELKANFFLNFSKADLKYKDSIIDLVKSGEITVFEDRLKEWRRFNIVDNGNNIKAKFKFHGSSTYPYLNGFESFTVKSNIAVNGRKKFKLITGLEMDFNNIFFNHIAKQLELIAEDTGEIVVTNSLGEYRDFFQYEVFDEEYLFNEYGLKDITIIRRLTFDNGKSNLHTSLLDDTPYNLDLKNISKERVILWEKFLNDPENNRYDSNYIGRFFALLQLFNNPHQIIGNNDKWVLSSDNRFYPVYREELNLIPLNEEDIESNLIFEKKYYSKSLDVYKKLLLDEDVLRARNLTFKKIIDLENQILKEYDSIYSSYESIYEKFGQNFLKTNLNKNRILSNLRNNIRSIKNYLNVGYTVLSYQDNKLRISSSRKNMLKIKLGEKTIYFLPIRLISNDLGKVKESPRELVIDGVYDINDLTIEDVVLKQKLIYEKDYSIIRIN